jgi:Spy/CpxP family protein refolding chaperone
MKRILSLTFLACGASLLLATAAQAQSTALVSSTDSTPGATPGAWAGHKHGGPGGKGGILEHLTDELSLSGSQQAAIAPILEAAKPQMKALREEFQQKRTALIESVSAQITPLLTSDQQAKFAGMVEKFEAGPGPGGAGPKAFARRGGPGGPGGGGPGAQAMLQRLTTQLGLTADQQSQIKPILDAAHTQIQSIHSDSTLTLREKFAKVKETMDAVHSQIDGILTPAQQQELAGMKEKFGRKNGPPPSDSSPTPTPSTN